MRRRTDAEIARSAQGVAFEAAVLSTGACPGASARREFPFAGTRPCSPHNCDPRARARARARARGGRSRARVS